MKASNNTLYWTVALVVVEAKAAFLKVTFVVNTFFSQLLHSGVNKPLLLKKKKKAVWKTEEFNINNVRKN